MCRERGSKGKVTAPERLAV